MRNQRVLQRYRSAGVFSRLSRGLLILALLANFTPFPPQVSAQVLMELPAPATPINASLLYVPPLLKGLIVHPQDPFQIDFIVDPGDSKLKKETLRPESTKMIKYFLAGLTIPEQDVWVNLSPYEKDRIIPEELATTEMGRDLLAQDYILKQLASSLTHPDKELGKEFWERVYTKARQLYGTTDIPLDTFNKVWVVPEKAVVYEHGATAVIVESRLKVMLEEDYVARDSSLVSGASDNKENKKISAEIVRAILIPELEREVNEGKHFDKLRQVYSAMILATWYKKKLKDNLLNQFYTNQKLIAGIESAEGDVKEKVYEQYLQAFRLGVYNFIKEEVDPQTQDVVGRKYFSGGLTIGQVTEVLAAVDQSNYTVDPAQMAAHTEDGFEIERTRFFPASPQEASTSDDAQLAKTYDQPNAEQQTFVDNVLLPLLGILPEEMKIVYGENAEGKPVMLIEHEEEDPSSRQIVKFQYALIFQGDDIQTSNIIDLNKVNEMTVLASLDGNWSEGMIEEMQYAVRRLLVADPFNPRFQGKIVLDKYQQEAVRSNLEAFETGNKALDVMATATGKTVVAFQTMKEYSEKLRSSGKEAGAVVFLVNNNIILREAEEKLHAMFPGQFKTSHIYEGENDISGDVIFATPTSLASQGRIEGLLRDRKISMVIFDEVHHVPAPILKSVYRRIEEESVRENWDTKFLGFTATEVRPDRVSVIRLFDQNIVYEYPIRRGRLEGSLVPMVYYQGDEDINPDNLGPIIPGHELYERYREERYRDERFPYLLKLYHQYSHGLLDKRGLILAPNVERSQALARFFRQQGITAVSLTATDRTANPQRFEDSYFAWRNGRWSQGSPFAQELVPQVVVAVDIFKEGIDVPAINIVMLWSSTDSTIEFMQSIGRGLRVAPFKTHLTVVDTIGLFRKVHLLRFLAGVYVHGKEDGRKKDKEKEPKAGVIGDGVAIDLDEGDIEKEEEPQAGPAVITGSAEVTRVLDEYLDALPDHLLYRYGTFSEIPIKILLGALDPWITIKAGFIREDRIGPEETKKGIKEMYAFMAETAQEIKSGELTDSGKDLFRKLFLQAFFRATSIGYDADIDQGRINANVPATFVVFSRLLQLLNLGRSEEEQIGPEALYEIFPEFDPAIKTLRKNRGKNLQLFRTRVLNRSYSQIVQEVLKLYEKNHFKQPTEVPRRSWGHVSYLLSDIQLCLTTLNDPGSAELHFMMAEGNRTEAKMNILRSESETLVGYDEDQEAVTQVYLLHPRVEGISLARADFDLTPDEFISRLRVLGLLPEGLTLTQFLTVLQEAVTFYVDAALVKNLERVAQTSAPLLELLRQPRNSDIITEYATQRQVDSLKSIFRQLREAVEKLGADARLEDRELLEIVKGYLVKAGIAWEQNIEELEGVSLGIERDSEDAELFDITLHQKTQVAPEQPAIPLQVIVKDDFIKRKHVLLTDVRVSDIEKFYASLDEDGKRALVDNLVTSLEGFVALYGEDLVFVVPRDKGEGTFWQQVFKTLMTTTSYNVLGPLQDVQDTLSKESLGFSFKILAGSRLSFLNPIDFSAYQRFSVTGNFTIAAKTLYMYRTFYEFSNSVLPRWQRLLPRIQAFASENQDDIKVKGHLLANLGSQMEKEVTGPKRMIILKRLFTILDNNGSDEPLKQEELYLADLYLWAGFKLWVGSSGIEVLSPMFGLLNRYFSLIDLVRGAGQEVPEDLQRDVNTIVRTVLRGYIHKIPLDPQIKGQLRPLEDRIRQAKDGFAVNAPSSGVGRVTNRVSRLDSQRVPISETIPSSASSEPVVKPSPPRSTPVIVRSFENTSPPYFMQHPVLLEDGDTAYFLALWVEEPTKKGGDAIMHWDGKHAAEVQAASPKKKIKLVTPMETRKYGKHKLCRICRSAADKATAGTPAFTEWEKYEGYYKSGKYSGHDIDGKTGKFKNGNGDEGKQSKEDTGGKEDAAMVGAKPTDLGGINLNANNIPLEIQMKGAESPAWNVNSSVEPLDIQGLTPFIFNSVPLPSLLPLLGFKADNINQLTFHQFDQ
jgi:superfamily II DNA or RNA helicase